MKPDGSGTALIATWTEPDPIRVNGKVSFYIIKYRKQGEINGQTTNRIGAEKLAFTISDLKPDVIYEAKIAAGSNSGLGQFTRDWVQATTVATKCKAIMSLVGKTYMISPQKWPGSYIYMVDGSDGNVRGWPSDPGSQGYWTFQNIGLNLYRVAPREWSHWYMYMQNGRDGNVRGWNGDPGEQGHWYVEQKGTVIIEGRNIPTYTFRPKAYPGWYMYMQDNSKGNVRGWNGDPDTAGYFIFTEI